MLGEYSCKPVDMTRLSCLFTEGVEVRNHDDHVKVHVLLLK